MLLGLPKILAILSAIQATLLVYVATVDVAFRLISNKICLLLVVLGIASRLFVGYSELGESVIAAAILFVLLLLLYNRRWIGGGDVKLLAALAVGLTGMQLIELLTVTALAGGVLASVHLMMRALPYPAIPPVGSSLIRRVYAVERWRNLRRAPLPYGVAIACGGMWTVLSQGV